MKTRFNWYFPPTDAEVDAIWRNGILTVDTNVLLDLYRYHERTRTSLIDSIGSFEGTRWLSHQASTEFVRNRTKVIISSEKTFKQASEEADKLQAHLHSSIGQLKGNRIIPADVTEELAAAMNSAIDRLRERIDVAKREYPRFIQDDPVLARLAVLFENAVGEDFDDADIPGIRSTADERKSRKIPPGYLDKDKDGDRPYGDYYLWRQILEQGRRENRPIILVTSERSEDWWEIISGKTTGPRPEMLKEARAFVGHPVLIYQTDRFLELSLQRLHRPVNSEAIEEIRAVSTQRTALQNAVTLISQDAEGATADFNSGRITAEINRPLRNFTVSGHFEPNMSSVPAITVHLLGSPEGMPSLKLKAGTGTLHDFNVHLVADTPGQHLPPGRYIIEYEALASIAELSIPQLDVAQPPDEQGSAERLA